MKRLYFICKECKNLFTCSGCSGAIEARKKKIMISIVIVINVVKEEYIVK